MQPMLQSKAHERVVNLSDYRERKQQQQGQGQKQDSSQPIVILWVPATIVLCTAVLWLIVKLWERS